jgi:hypothetical protein
LTQILRINVSSYDLTSVIQYPSDIGWICLLNNPYMNETKLTPSRQDNYMKKFIKINLNLIQLMILIDWKSLKIIKHLSIVLIN